jgi:hypothetical protein
MVFAQRAAKSISARGLADKLQFAYTGPWRVVQALDGASYELEHAHLPGKKEKKHASDLSPYPIKLIAFQPLDGPDNCYGQLYKPISAKQFFEAGLKGFIPTNPYCTSEVRTTTNLRIPAERFCWPTLSDLNDELDSALCLWALDGDAKRWREAEAVQDCPPVLAAESAVELRRGLPDLTPGPPPAAPSTSIPIIPSIESLHATMILSEDKLLFISIPIGTNNVQEWRLVQLDYELSVSLSPSCLQTGRYLFKLLIGHPADWRYNAINWRYWLQYFKESDVLNPDQSSKTH